MAVQYLYVSEIMRTDFGKIRAHIVDRYHIEFQTLGGYKFAVDKRRVEVRCHIIRRSTGWGVGLPPLSQLGVWSSRPRRRLPVP